MARHCVFGGAHSPASAGLACGPSQIVNSGWCFGMGHCNAGRGGGGQPHEGELSEGVGGAFDDTAIWYAMGNTKTPLGSWS